MLQYWCTCIGMGIECVSSLGCVLYKGESKEAVQCCPGSCAQLMSYVCQPAAIAQRCERTVTWLPMKIFFTPQACACTHQPQMVA
jgi:hypothetical protein